MNDYKELINKLRNACEWCNGSTPHCKVYKNMQQAADAIEQLVKERDAAYEALNRLKECSTCGHYHECGYDDIECVACENGSEYVFGGVKE